MQITLNHIPIRDIVVEYKDNGEDGVKGYNGKLDIRPQYQREFVYKDKQRNEVIHSINKDFPLNVLYWVDREDGTYEVLDGQQRIISICQYHAGDYSIEQDGDPKYFDGLTKEQKKQILDYELTIYFCKGTDQEKLDWFRVVNVAGERLYEQELRNAVYHGEFISEAKGWFSKRGCPAYDIGNKYLQGSPIRQDYLETALKWISDGEIKNYMAKHRHDKTAADALWQHFEAVIEWVKKIFPHYDKAMQSVDWGSLHTDHKDDKLDPEKLQQRVLELVDDDDVDSVKGIYSYLLTGQEKHLNLRAFNDKQKRKAYNNQNGKCTICKKNFAIDDMQADHIKPWSEGGKTIDSNLQMLCKQCNREKGAR